MAVTDRFRVMLAPLELVDIMVSLFTWLANLERIAPG